MENKIKAINKKNPLFSIDIDDVVKDINKDKMILKEETKGKEESNVSSFEKSINKDPWKEFIDSCSAYEYRSSKISYKRKCYGIDEDIINTFKLCNINKMAISDIINAALRSFISINKDALKAIVEHRRTLI